ncbi:hypothetical protein [Geobacter sp. AOG2]|uniref:hypothetical protein n=1 Tax=Geobacter sp. AOG2 TaxID=1566347 RepID=UPI001CC51F03|nr:hypothetical protein [Geobacter sp. AOG2]GFE61855.1 hypothetical protein AOG2_24430 [Geobacter sp. AOG2]
MRFIVTVLLLLLLFPLAATSRADEKSDCLAACTTDKRSVDMYCPPAGGFSDEDHKQCMDKNDAAYNDCIKACSPAPTIPEPPASAVTDHEPVPPVPTEQPAVTDHEPVPPAPTEQPVVTNPEPVPSEPAEPSAAPPESPPTADKQQ